MSYVSQRFIENCSAQIASVEKPSDFEENHISDDKNFENEDRKGEDGHQEWIDWLPKKMKYEMGKNNASEIKYNTPQSRDLPIAKYGSSVNNFYPKETIDMG